MTETQTDRSPLIPYTGSFTRYKFVTYLRTNKSPSSAQ